MINVVCLKFGTKYDADYVNKLYRAVERNTTIDYKFHCFTEDRTGLDPNIIIQDLPHSLPGVGWWHKLYMFSADINIDGRIFYIDLDTLVTGNIDHILQCQDEFVVLHDFFRMLQPEVKDKFGLGKDAVGSGVMMWTAGKHTHIWDSFVESGPEKVVKSLHPHGDQKWIEINQPTRSYYQDLFPGQVVSYKVHCKDGLPDDARIVCYHGKPSIPESITQRVFKVGPSSWVKEYW